MKIITVILFLCLSVCAFCAVDYTFNPNLSPVPYGYGVWQEDGYGNHRAIAEVEDPAENVLADIEWRRFDKKPELKNIIVMGPEGSVSWTVGEINNFHGEIIFTAHEKGTYYIYYMPYISSAEYNISKTDYFPFAPTKEFKGDINTLPKAKILRIECRAEDRSYNQYEMDYDRDNFYSMYPMLITVTENELSEFISKYNKRNFTVFCEDRTNPIKMLHQIPYKWYKQGETDEFTGTAQPNEIYTFQIGVYALKDIKDLKVSFDFPFELHCINTGGIDFKGNPFTKTVNISKGDVQPLWFYVRMGDKGEYKGSVTIEGNEKTKIIPINIKVDGEYLKDGGVSESWRMSRISWLDSKKGLEDKVIAPYVPVQVNGNKISVLNRTITLNDFGFPVQVTSNKINILQKPLDFGLYANNKKIILTPKSKKIIKQNDAVYEAEYISSNSDLELCVRPVIEFDGICEYYVSLKALKDIDLSDVVLFVPYNKSVAKYAMGLAFRGGIAPLDWTWNWENDGSKHLAWLGDYDAGMQVRLELKNHKYYNGHTFSKDYLPEGWYNDNKGKIALKSENKYYSFKAQSGAKTLKAGDVCDYDFRLSVTPFKPFDEKRYSYRIGGDAHANTKLVFHSERGNTFINYPFAENDYLRNIVNSYKNMSIKDNFKITYNLENTTTEKGSVTVWVESIKDWATEPNQFSVLALKNGLQEFDLYWNPMAKTIFPESVNFGKNNVYTANHLFSSPSDIPGGSMKVGDKHILTFAWTKENLKLYMDGNCVFDRQEKFVRNEGPINFLVFDGSMFNIKAIRYDNDVNLDQEIRAGENTVLFDTFRNTFENGDFKPQIGDRGSVFGSYTQYGDYVGAKDFGRKDIETDIYYTSRELSNKCQEIWALRSLGDEIFSEQGFLYTAQGATDLTEDGGGYQWLSEQLGSGYVPAWHMKLSDGCHCAAFAVNWDCRWLNYYIEGVDYLMKNVGIRGVYLDGIGYTRDTMKRVAKVMAENRSDYVLDYHTGNEYDYMDKKASPLNTSMEHMPYVTNLWIGEMFDYDRNPDYWFTEISGEPFGVPSEMLENGSSNCNSYRGMVYGMSGRQMRSAYPMYFFWDNWHIEKSEIIGYWDKKPAVFTDSDKVFATAYKQKGKALIAVASWNNEDTEKVNIKIDWKRLGLDKNKVKISQPNIDNFQEYKDIADLENIEIVPGKGFIWEIEE